MVAGGSETQHTNLFGIGRKQMGQSSFGGGSLNKDTSRSSAARNLHAALCVGQCFFWHSALQYLTFIHDLHILRLTTPPPSSPHWAQQWEVALSQLFIPDFLGWDLRGRQIDETVQNNDTKIMIQEYKSCVKATGRCKMISYRTNSVSR
jgi:hypothetical protein